MSFFYKHSFFSGQCRGVIKGSTRKAFWKGSDKCWALMMLSLSNRSKILLDHTFIKKWSSLSLPSPQASHTVPDTGDLQIFADFGMFGPKHTPALCKLLKDQHTTHFVLRAVLLPSHQDRKDISQQLLFTQFRAWGASPHYKSALCPAEQCGHPGIWMPREFLLVWGSFPFFFCYLKVSQKKSLPVSKLGISVLTRAVGTEQGAKSHQNKTQRQRFGFNEALEQNPNTHWFQENPSISLQHV